MSTTTLDRRYVSRLVPDNRKILLPLLIAVAIVNSAVSPCPLEQSQSRSNIDCADFGLRLIDDERIAHPASLLRVLRAYHHARGPQQRRHVDGGHHWLLLRAAFA